jgi:hypothetical protein
MRTSRIVAGVVAVVVLAGVGGAIVASRGGGDGSGLASPAAVKSAFAKRGITVRYAPNVGPNPSVKVARPLGSLTTALNRVTSGNLDIIVLSSLRDAKRLGALRMNLSSRDECGRRGSSDLFTWRVKNVLVTYDRCDFTRKPYRVASPASYRSVLAAVGDLGSYSSIR